MASAVQQNTTGVWSAPGRVNLIGEHTDYNGGLALPFAIDRRTRATIGPAAGPGLHLSSAFDPDGAVHSITAGDLQAGRGSGWTAYVAGVVWALDLIDRLETTGLEIAISSDVPVGSGLSSSAALMCSTAIALNDIFQLGLDPVALAHLTQKVENDFVGAPTGGMDQRVSLLGRRGHAVLFDVQADSTTLVPFDPEPVGLTVLAVDTTVTHANVDGGYGARRADCQRAAEILGVSQLREVSVDQLRSARPVFAALNTPDADRAYRRARHVVTEIARVEEMVEALGASDWDRVGGLMSAAHVSIRDDFEASCPELDTAVETMIASGGLGARMTGGGFGGTAIGLVPVDQATTIAGQVEAGFATAGFAPPRSFVVTPSDGAHRDN